MPKQSQSPPQSPLTPTSRAKTLQWVTLAVTVLSLHSFFVIPFVRPGGHDLHNLYQFHHCKAGDNPYAVSGRQCGDREGRNLYYPPLLYYSFSWLQYLKADTSYYTWALFILAASILTLFLWFSDKERTKVGRWQLPILWTLFSLSFPVLFAVERGNNDIVVFVLFSLAYWMYKKRFHVVSGGLMGLAAAYKLYPAIAVFVIILALFFKREDTANPSPLWVRLRQLFPLLAGAIIGVFVPIIIMGELYWYYFTKVIPEFSNHVRPLSFYSHSIVSLGLGRHAPVLLAFLVGGLWIWALARMKSKNVFFLFAGPLAISTYFSNVTNDYNLMTTYPLLMGQFLFAMGEPSDKRHSHWILFFIGLTAIIADRSLFIHPFYCKGHMLLQIGWLIASAIYISKWKGFEHPSTDNEIKKTGSS